jgi:hypothetical protein
MEPTILLVIAFVAILAGVCLVSAVIRICAAILRLEKHQQITNQLIKQLIAVISANE